MKHFVPILAAIAVTIAGMLFPHTLSAAPFFPDTCTAPDAGGSADLPANCNYVPSSGTMHIVNGLPPGTTIEADPILSTFSGIIRTPGGPLGGETESFLAQLQLHLTGTGTLTGFNRIVTMGTVNCQIDAASRKAGSAIQRISLDLDQLQGQLPPGDPDFDLLRVTAGTGFGLPSPGHTTLTRVPGGNWNVDCFFDLNYRIDFVGSVGGVVAGMSGSTTDAIRLQQGATIPLQPDTCTAPDASGTADLPAACPYVAPDAPMLITNGLPALTTIEVTPLFSGFSGIIRLPGGSLGGETEAFSATLDVDLNGTGSKAGFFRSVSISMTAFIEAAPRDAGADVQSFALDFNQLQGQLPPGDPDFDLLRVTAGSGFGMPSPGHTTLTRTSGGDWNVDSYFDITYRIDFVGAAGGALAGMSGSTTATIRWRQGVEVPPPVEPTSLLHYGLYLDNLMDPIDRLLGDPAQYFALAGETLIPTFVVRNNTGSDTTVIVRLMVAGQLDGLGVPDTAYNDSISAFVRGFETKTFRMNSFQFDALKNEGDFYATWQKGDGTPIDPVPLRKGKCGFKFLTVTEQPDGSFKVTKHIVNRKDHDCPYTIEFFWDYDAPNSGIKPGHSLGGGTDVAGAGGDVTVEVDWSPAPGRYCVFAKTTIQGKTFIESLNHIKVKKDPPPPPGPPPPPPPPPPLPPWPGKWWPIPVPILADSLCADTMRVVVVADTSGRPAVMSTDTVYYPCPGFPSDTIWLFVYVPDSSGSADTSRYSVVLIDRDDKVAGYSTYELVRVDGTPGTLYPQAVLAWNLMSLPVRVPDGSLAATYPTAISNAFMFDGSYVSTDSVWPAAGFWLKFDSAQTVALSGTLNLLDTSEVKKGWNIIGSLSDTIPVGSLGQEPPGIVLSSFYSFDGSYQTATRLAPGVGYWVKVSSDGLLIHSYTGWPKTAAAESAVPPGLNALSIVDGAGRGQTLYVGDAIEPMPRMELFELPPLPPEGAFDARFGSQRLVELHPADAAGLRIPIEVRTAATGPVTVSLHAASGAGARYAIEFTEGGRVRSVELRDGVGTSVPQGARLTLVVNGSGAIPTEYAVAQNYPNPFNPTSRIDFDMPEDGLVTLIVFDVLGQEVARALDRREFGAGRHSAIIDAGGLSSGVYFYRLEVVDPAGGSLKFRTTMKMALVR